MEQLASDACRMITPFANASAWTLIACLSKLLSLRWLVLLDLEASIHILSHEQKNGMQMLSMMREDSQASEEPTTPH